MHGLAKLSTAREIRIPSEMCARKRVLLMGNTHP